MQKRSSEDEEILDYNDLYTVSHLPLRSSKRFIASLLTIFISNVRVDFIKFQEYRMYFSYILNVLNQYIRYRTLRNNPFLENSDLP